VKYRARFLHVLFALVAGLTPFLGRADNGPLREGRDFVMIGEVTDLVDAGARVLVTEYLPEHSTREKLVFGTLAQRLEYNQMLARQPADSFKPHYESVAVPIIIVDLENAARGDRVERRVFPTGVIKNGVRCYSVKPTTNPKTQNFGDIAKAKQGSPTPLAGGSPVRILGKVLRIESGISVVHVEGYQDPETRMVEAVSLDIFVEGLKGVKEGDYVDQVLNPMGEKSGGAYCYSAKPKIPIPAPAASPEK